MFAALIPPWWNLAAAGMLVVALVGVAWKLHHSGLVAGRAEVQTLWDAEKLALVELARRSLAGKATANQGVDRDLQNRKAATGSINLANDYSVRQFQAAAAARYSSAAPASGRADAAATSIASECAAAVTALDGYARQRVDQIAGLQSYVTDVCQPK